MLTKDFISDVNYLSVPKKTLHIFCVIYYFMLTKYVSKRKHCTFFVLITFLCKSCVCCYEKSITFFVIVFCVFVFVAFVVIHEKGSHIFYALASVCCYSTFLAYHFFLFIKKSKNILMQN